MVRGMAPNKQCLGQEQLCHHDRKIEDVHCNTMSMPQYIHHPTVDGINGEEVMLQVFMGRGFILPSLWIEH